MQRIPLVLINGRVSELPTEDTLRGSLAEGDEIVYSKRIDFITGDDIYRGEALVGSTEASAVWRIRRIYIDATGDISEKWADGSASFDKIWANRLAYSYI